MPQGEHITPDVARMNPAMQLPFAESSEGKILEDSRAILRYCNDGAGSEEVEGIVDAIYGSNIDSLAIITGAKSICLMGCLQKSGIGQSKMVSQIRKYQKAEPGLHDIYENKVEALTTKHFSKKQEDCARDTQAVVDMLEKRYTE